MAAQYELIKYTLEGKADVTDGVVTQNINIVSNQVGNTYPARYITNTVSPIPTFDATLTIVEAQLVLQAAALAYLATLYPNT